MYFPQYLALALVTFFKSTHATPLGLSKRQGASQIFKHIGINFCQDWNGGGTCTNIPTFVLPTSDTDDAVTSNYATQVNSANINGISSVTVSGDSGVKCRFGYVLLSTVPSTICGGWSAPVNSGDPTYDFSGPVNDNMICYFCSAQA